MSPDPSQGQSHARIFYYSLSPRENSLTRIEFEKPQTANPPALRRFELAASTFLPCGVSAHLAPCFTPSPSVTSSSRTGSVGSWGRRFDRPSSVVRCGWPRIGSFLFSVFRLHSG